jgi:SAM-dependent methyltransferase
MAHTEQRIFVESVKNKFIQYFSHKTVLEVGSLNINGTVRDFFSDCNYVGLDVSFGEGVDIVCEGQNYNAPDNSYDVVCSAECFEHNPYWLETFKNMVRLCKNDGLVFFTCATDGRREHGTTRTTPGDSPLTIGMGWDYYRNLNENDFRSQLNFEDYFESYEFSVEENSHDLYFWGIVRKTKKKSIPIIGIPMVNGFHWLQRLIDSIDYPVDEVFVINNNGRGQFIKELDGLSTIKHKFIKKITVTHLPSNLGCSGAWNLIIKCYMNVPYWIIANNDIAFTPGLLQEFAEKSNDDTCGVIKGKEFQWDLFLIKDWVIQECGLFDENFYPAYLEDCDYYIRLLNKNISIGYLENTHLHGDKGYETSGSQTWRLEPEIADKLHSAHNINFGYITEKWGENWRDSNWQYNQWQYPFNNENIPITYTKYDLKFCRNKNLGF